MVKQIPIDIDKLILQLDAKLPQRRVVYVEKPYLELWNMTVSYYLAPIRMKINHNRKMRLAWLASGNVGLIEYVQPFIKNKAKFELIRKIILAIK